ncbi:MAG: hypothetical protein LC624_01000 [Halobacteriales archaeon]|nr:hypothetical protein [Halobacteriales archaeon]
MLALVFSASVMVLSAFFSFVGVPSQETAEGASEATLAFTPAPIATAPLLLAAALCATIAMQISISVLPLLLLTSLLVFEGFTIFGIGSDLLLLTLPLLVLVPFSARRKRRFVSRSPPDAA